MAENEQQDQGFAVIEAAPIKHQIIHHRWRTLIWASCIDCGKERWVRLSKGQPLSLRCKTCAGKKVGHAAFRDGKKHVHGYISIKIYPDDPFYCMARSGGYVLEHRLLMARAIGRPLFPSEKVHHKDGIKDHNSEENLKLISRANHNIYTELCSHCELRKEIRLLRWQVKELTEALQLKLGGER